MWKNGAVFHQSLDAIARGYDCDGRQAKQASKPKSLYRYAIYSSIIIRFEQVFNNMTQFMLA